MATRNTDVNLIVRARTEGEKAVEALANIVQALGGDAMTASGGVAELGKNLSTLDKLFATISGKADGAADAFDRQTSALAKAKDELRGVAQAASEYQRNMDTVRTGIVDGVMNGRDVSALRTTLQQLEGEMGKLDTRTVQLRRTVDNLEGGIEGSRSSLQRLGSTVNAVEATQAAVRTRIESTTTALNQQAAAAQNASQLLEAINRSNAPALFNGPATSNGATTGELIRQFQQLEAEATKVRNSLDPLTGAVTRYEEKVRALQQLVAGGHLGADEMAAQERELTAALKDTLQQIGFVDAAEQDRVRKGVGAIEQLTRAERAYANVLAERANIEMALERSTGAGKMAATDMGASYQALAQREQMLAERRRLLEQGEAATQQAAIARIERTDRPAATDAGATYSALAERAAEQEAQALREAAHAYEMFEAAARKGAAAMRDSAQEAERDAAEVQRLRDRLDPLAAIQNRFNEQLQRYQQLAARGKITTDELTEAERRLTTEAEQARAALSRAGDAATGGGKGAKGQIGLFGLKPYELQNLSYQVNDVVTQLASGTSLSQTLAQQGGQILQLFPRVGGAVIGALSNPAILGFVVTVGAIALGLKQAADQAARLREFSATLAFRTDGGDYNPKALADQSRDLDAMGAKAKEAQAALKEFVQEGVNPELLAQFGRVALETARVLGTDLASAAKDVAEGFTGGFDAVAKLDDKLNFLTASERAHIQQLFNEGNAQAARTEALNAYTRQADAAAAKQRGPWGQAAQSLERAWKSLMDWIANSAPIKATIFVLNELAGAVKAVGDAVSGSLGEDATKGGAAASAAKMAEAQAQIKKLEADIANYNEAIAKGSPIAGTLRALVTQSQAQLDRAKAQLAALEKNSPDTVNDDPNGTKAKQRAERLADIDLEEQLQTLRKRGSDDGLNKPDSKRRETLAGEVAFRAEMKSTGDAIVAGRLRERAVAEETLAVDKQNDDARKKAISERERELRQFETRVIGAEGGAGKNPFSSAKGYGQFTESTWVSQFKKVFPSQADDLSRQQILALRQNETVARAIIDSYARENARFLESFGAKVTAGNLYLTHFLGAGGAKAVLTAPGDTPVDTILRRLPNSEQVLSGNKGYLRTNGGKGRYRTADELETFIAGRVGDTGGPQSEGQVAINKLIEESVDKQEEFNTSVRHGAEDRQRAIDGLTKEFGLIDSATIAEQRRQAVAQAVLDLKQKAEDANKNLKPGETPVVVSPEQIAEVERLTGALFDAAHAADLLKAGLNEQERPLNNLQAQREILQQQADFLRSIGDNEGADKLDRQVDGINAKIRQAVEALITFYQNLTPEQLVALGIKSKDELDALIAKLRLGTETTQQWGKVAGISGKDIAQAFASSAVQAVTNFVNKVAAGKNVFKSLGESVREFAASFLASIAQMILQLLAFAAAVTILRALGVPVPTSLFPVGSKHTGGVAGRADGNGTRMVNPAIFAAALRYHNGGIAGLKPNEVPTVLEEGEEVLTTGNPRHINNVGKGGGPAPANNGDITIIQVPDHAAALEQGLRSPAGGRVFFDFVRENQSAFKAAMG